MRHRHRRLDAAPPGEGHVARGHGTLTASERSNDLNAAGISSNNATLKWPLSLARCIAAAPVVGCRMSGRAPACISRLTHSRCPAVAAAPSADHPTFPSALRMGGSGEALACKSSLIISAKPLAAASTSAEQPGREVRIAPCTEITSGLAPDRRSAWAACSRFSCAANMRSVLPIDVSYASTSPPAAIHACRLLSQAASACADSAAWLIAWNRARGGEEDPACASPPNEPALPAVAGDAVSSLDGRPSLFLPVWPSRSGGLAGRSGNCSRRTTAVCPAFLASCSAVRPSPS
mmetsp:Transcript_5167/g.17112  ORF Transcript_5167/g.17112 Transcript_5167/m.17112 type:complete len:291 (+) Transcript_5167:162-1034(+)